MRGTHEHQVDQVIMGGRDKPGHDEWGGRGAFASPFVPFVFFVPFVVE